MLEGSDEQLIISHLKGDEEALRVLIRRYLKPIYNFAYRYVKDGQEAEDITQETFIKVWKNLKKFDRTKKFKTWIFSIAKNTSFDFLRKKKAIPFSKFENEEGENKFLERLVEPALLPDELFEKANIKEILNIAMKQLSPKYRMVLFLRHNDHFTFREIADVFGESVNTVKSRHRRALILLKKLLLK